MPYITKDRRKEIEKCDSHLDIFGKIGQLNKVIETEGELNYVITKLCHSFIERKRKKYSTLNTVIGVLECAKLELYRRIIAPYENQKIKENGNV